MVKDRKSGVLGEIELVHVEVDEYIHISVIYILLRLMPKVVYIALPKAELTNNLVGDGKPPPTFYSAYLVVFQYFSIATARTLKSNQGKLATRR